MAKMKNLNDYLAIKCPMWADLTDTECRECGVDPADLKCEFLRHEVHEDRGVVSYFYQCNLCGEEHVNDVPIEKDFVYIGECPSAEDPFPEYTTSVTCTVLIAQLREQFGVEPVGAKLTARYEAGADGRTVVCNYDTRFPMSEAYAYLIEGNLPEKWSPKAIKMIEEMTRRPFVRKDQWVMFWFDSNVWFNYVRNRDDWNCLKETLKRNGYETSPLAAKSCTTSGRVQKFGLYSEYTEEYTLRDFFRDNGMKP